MDNGTWNLRETISYYQKQGAPKDQTALIQLLKEIQTMSGGSVPRVCIGEIMEAYGIPESLLLAVIRRIPSLRLSGSHCLELCAGETCGKHAALAKAAEALCDGTVTVKYTPCMRQCGKGPNIRWDGKLYSGASETLLRKLMEKL